MSTKYVAKPIKVEAFQYGTDTSPLWFLTAIRKRQIQIMPSKGHIVAKTESGKINFYDPITFNALFETEVQAKDLNNDGIIDAREKAIASETTKLKKPVKPESLKKKSKRTTKPKEEEGTKED